MTHDILFLLKHGFSDGLGAPFYCPECAQINGVLHYYPALRHTVEVRYVDFPRPRHEIVELIGAANQSCPVLVLAGAPQTAEQGIEIGNHDGQRFVAGAHAIGEYWARSLGIGRPH